MLRGGIREQRPKGGLPRGDDGLRKKREARSFTMGTIVSGTRRACACAAAPARHQVRVPATEARREQLVSRYEVSSNPADGSRLLIHSAP